MGQDPREGNAHRGEKLTVFQDGPLPVSQSPLCILRLLLCLKVSVKVVVTEAVWFAHLTHLLSSPP